MTYHRIFNKNNKPDATSGAELSTLPEHLSLHYVFTWDRVTQSLVFCGMCYESLFAFLFSFILVICIVCPSSIYSFCLFICMFFALFFLFHHGRLILMYSSTLYKRFVFCLFLE